MTRAKLKTLTDRNSETHNLSSSESSFLQVQSGSVKHLGQCLHLAQLSFPNWFLANYVFSPTMLTCILAMLTVWNL